MALTYDADSRRATLTLPNGVTVSYGYDNAGQLINLNYTKGATSLGNLSYSYDNTGQRVQLGGSLARTNLPGAVSAASYNAANQLTTWGSASLLYDANGNMTSDGSNTYIWDSPQRLSTLTGTTSGSFSYDALGRRSQKTIAGQTTGYVFDGINLVQELTGAVNPAVQANLLTGSVDEIFSRTEVSGGTYSYLVDALGSTQALTDSTGAVTTQYTYEPYGQTSSSGSASANSQQYTGRENDGTGVYYYRARYYSPGFGRFISGDPIGLAGGINTYTYVNGSPISNVDPLGLWTANIGFSGSLNVQLVGPVGVGGSGFAGVAYDGKDFAWYGGAGAGAGVGVGTGAAFGIQIGGSNAESVCDLAGPFKSASVSGGAGVVVGGEGYTGKDSNSKDIVGGNVFFGGGGGTPVTGTAGGTYTYIHRR